MFRVRVIAKGVRRALQLLDDRITSSARQALGQAAAYAAERARTTSTFKDRTGRLRRSIQRGAKSTYSLFVRTGARYALFVEDGTRPHVISARRARALRFVVGGTTVFRTSVRHPGTKATHFMRTARDNAEAQLTRFVEVGIRQAVSG